MDKLSQINALLEKFYEGKSSLDEEQQLAAFFEGDRVPESLAAEKELFKSINAAKVTADIPEDLDAGILKQLDEAMQREQRTRRINFYSISGLAAGLLIILSIYLGFLRDDHMGYQAQVITVEDPEQAYEETMKALSYISSKWSEGTRELQNLDQVNKSMESIKPIRKLSSGSRELNLLGNLKKAENIKIQ